MLSIRTALLLVPVLASLACASNPSPSEARPKPAGNPEVSDPLTVHPVDQLNWGISPQ